MKRNESAYVEYDDGIVQKKVALIPLPKDLPSIIVNKKKEIWSKTSNQETIHFVKEKIIETKTFDPTSSLEVMQIVNFLEPAKLLLEDAFLSKSPYKFSLLSNTVNVLGTSLKDIKGAANMIYYRNGAVSFDYNLAFKLCFQLNVNVTVAQLVQKLSKNSRSDQKTDKITINGYINVKDLGDLDALNLDVVFPPEKYDSDPRNPLAGFIGSQCRAALKSHRSQECIKMAVHSFEMTCVETLKAKLAMRKLKLGRRGGTSMQGRRSSSTTLLGSLGAPRRTSSIGLLGGRRSSAIGLENNRTNLSNNGVANDDIVVGGVAVRKDLDETIALLQIAHGLVPGSAGGRRGSSIGGRGSTMNTGTGIIKESIIKRRASVALGKGSASLVMFSDDDQAKATLQSIRNQFKTNKLVTEVIEEDDEDDDDIEDDLHEINEEMSIPSSNEGDKPKAFNVFTNPRNDNDDSVDSDDDTDKTGSYD